MAKFRLPPSLSPRQETSAGYTLDNIQDGINSNSKDDGAIKSSSPRRPRGSSDSTGNVSEEKSSPRRRLFHFSLRHNLSPRYPEKRNSVVQGQPGDKSSTPSDMSHESGDQTSAEIRFDQIADTIISLDDISMSTQSSLDWLSRYTSTTHATTTTSVRRYSATSNGSCSAQTPSGNANQFGGSNAETNRPTRSRSDESLPSFASASSSLSLAGSAAELIRVVTREEGSSSGDVNRKATVLEGGDSSEGKTITDQDKTSLEFTQRRVQIGGSNEGIIKVVRSSASDCGTPSTDEQNSDDCKPDPGYCESRRHSASPVFLRSALKHGSAEENLLKPGAPIGNVGVRRNTSPSCPMGPKRVRFNVPDEVFVDDKSRRSADNHLKVASPQVGRRRAFSVSHCDSRVKAFEIESKPAGETSEMEFARMSLRAACYMSNLRYGGGEGGRARAESDSSVQCYNSPRRLNNKIGFDQHFVPRPAGPLRGGQEGKCFRDLISELSNETAVTWSLD